MDAALGIAVGTATVRLVLSTTDLGGTRLFCGVALGLAQTLLALSILDATPSYWNVFMNHHYLVLAYRTVLWALSGQILVWAPFTVGLQLAEAAQDVLLGSSCCLWMLQSLCGGLKCRLCRLWFGRWLRRSTSHAVLPRHNSAAGESTTGEVSVVQCLFGLLCVAGVFLLIDGSMDEHDKSSTINEDDEAPTLLAHIVSALTTTGLWISAILNGFGSVSLPFNCLTGICLQPIPTEAIQAAERELEHARAALRAKQPPSGQSFATLDADQRRALVERQFLETLQIELQEELTEIRRAAAQAARARTAWGRGESALGVVFSVVLLVRLGMAVVAMSMMTPRARVDPVTVVLVWLMGRNWVSAESYNMVAQGTSLVLTAILSVTQVRTFLRTVHILQRRWNASYCGSASWLNGGDMFLQVAACGLLSYSLACCVLTKNLLPTTFHESLSIALGYTVVASSQQHQGLFVGSSIASAIVLTTVLGIQRHNSMRYGRSFPDTKGAVPLVLEP